MSHLVFVEAILLGIIVGRERSTVRVKPDLNLAEIANPCFEPNPNSPNSSL